MCGAIAIAVRRSSQSGQPSQNGSGRSDNGCLLCKARLPPPHRTETVYDSTSAVCSTWCTTRCAKAMPASRYSSSSGSPLSPPSLGRSEHKVSPPPHLAAAVAPPPPVPPLQQLPMAIAVREPSAACTAGKPAVHMELLGYIEAGKPAVRQYCPLMAFPRPSHLPSHARWIAEGAAERGPANSLSDHRVCRWWRRPATTSASPSLCQPPRRRAAKGRKARTRRAGKARRPNCEL